MVTKEEALEFIKTISEQKVVSKEEMDAAFELASGGQKDVVSKKRLGIAQILYYIGGIIVFLGISIFLGQNWSMLNFAAKVLATIGSGIAAYIIGLLFSRDKNLETVSSAFYLIFSLVTPVGLWVVLDNAGFDVASYGFQSLICAIMLGVCLISFFVLKKNVFALFSILFGTWLFFSLTSFMVEGNLYFNDWKFYLYRILAVGITYILLGYSFTKNKELVSFQGFLYGFGIFGFLAAALSLGGMEPEQNLFWELIYPVLIFATLFLSVHIKSKAFLVWGALFLMAYIFKITAEYFSDSLGWPLALVIAGLGMIGVGYMSLLIKNKYFSS